MHTHTHKHTHTRMHTHHTHAQTHSPRHVLPLELLSAAAFEPFGQVIEARLGAAPVSINDGFADRYDSAAVVATAQGGGATRVGIYRARRHVLPFQLSGVERHLLGSQLFIPLAAQRFVVVVAVAGPAPQGAQLRAFLVGAGQSVNMAPGTWHHPLLALDDGDFFVVDRRGPGGAQDCEVHLLASAEVWIEG